MDEAPTGLRPDDATWAGDHVVTKRIATSKSSWRILENIRNRRETGMGMRGERPVAHAEVVQHDDRGGAVADAGEVERLHGKRATGSAFLRRDNG